MLSTGTACGTTFTDVCAVMQLHPDGQGGAFSVWSNGFRVRVQRVTSDGDISPGWPTDGVMAGPGLNAHQQFPRSIPDGAGGVIVAWWDTRQSQNRIFAQRVTSSGARAWADSGRIVSGSGLASGFDLAQDGSGGAFVGWNDATNERLMAVHIDAAGAVVPGWPPFGLDVCPAAVHPITPSLAADGAGGVILAWTEPREVISWSLYSIRLNSDGSLAAGWPASGALLCQAPERREDPLAVPDGGGGAWVSWTDTRVSNAKDVYAQHVLDDGTLAPGWTTAGKLVSGGLGEQGGELLLIGGPDGMTVVWTDTRNGSDDLYGSRLLADGELASGWTDNGTPLCILPLRQWHPVMLADPIGGAWVGWTDKRNAVDDDVYLSRITGAGTVAPGWPANGVGVCTAAGNQGPSAICTDGGGGVIVAWRDFRRGVNFSPDIYAARVDMDGLVPALVSLVEAFASDQGVRVEWQLGTPAATRPGAERREPTTGWITLPEPSMDGTGRCRIEDREVNPGGRYGYRLSWTDSNGRRNTGEEVWLNVPRTDEFGVRGVYPNPIQGESATIQVGLAGTSPATLEWFDIRGRRVASRALSPSTGGNLSLRLEAESRLPSGLYFIRLRQGQRSAWIRAAIAH